MGFTQLLLDGLAAYLDARGVGVWSPAAPYPPGVVGIVVGDLQQAPDRQIAMRLYGRTPHPEGLSDVTMRVQLRVRGAPGDVHGADAIADAAQDVLDNAQRLFLPNGVPVVQIVQSVSAPIGTDTAGRYERADSYAIDTQHETALRFD